MKMNQYLKTGTRQKQTKISRLLSPILTSPILIAVALSPWIVIVYLLLQTYVVSLDPNDTMLILSFIEWFGTPYGLLSILVLMKVWNNFESLEREFDREVSTLARLIEAVSLMAKRVPTSQRTKANLAIADSVIAYTHHILNNYDLEYRDVRLSEKGDHLLSRLQIDINRINPGSRSRISFAIIDSLVNQVLDARRERLMLSKQRLPTGISFLLLISSILWLLPFLALAIYNAIVNLLVVGSISFVIMLLLLVIQDLNNPFGGSWSINLDKWIAVQEIALELRTRVREDQKEVKEMVTNA